MHGETHRIGGLILLAAGPFAPLPHPGERHGMKYRGCVGETARGWRCCARTHGWFCSTHEPQWSCDPPPSYPTNVYFVLAERSGLVKIGKANDVARRLSGLRCGSPEPLTLLRSLPADLSLEVMLHARFSEARHHGEWFVAEPVLALVETATDEEIREFAYQRVSTFSPQRWARLLLADLPWSSRGARCSPTS